MGKAKPNGYNLGDRLMRLYRMILECTTPLHCGGGDESLVQDQPVTRDAFGFWRIPGSSLAGLLRHEALNYASAAVVDKAFGVQKGENSQPSFIWCADGVLLDFDDQPATRKAMSGQRVNISCGPFVRDHVRIHPELGSAEQGGKFDEEIVPVGTRFALEITLDGWNAPEPEDVRELFEILCALLGHARLHLGGKTGSGYGRYRVLSHVCRELNMYIPQEMTAWLNLSAGPQFAPDEKGRTIPVGTPPDTDLRAGLNGYLTIPFRSRGPLLVGGGRPTEHDHSQADADILCATVPRMDYSEQRLQYDKVVPGTSFKGVLRHRVRRVLQCLACPDIEKIMKPLFGDVSDNGGQCGKVSCQDSLFNAPVTMVQHVAIDRFTSGALEGALYCEASAWSDNLNIPFHIEVENLELHEVALLLHALADMAAGELPVGSGGNRGNGVLYLPHWPENPALALQAVYGELRLNGKLLFPGEPGFLEEVLIQLDQALKARLTATTNSAEVEPS